MEFSKRTRLQPSAAKNDPNSEHDFSALEIDGDYFLEDRLVIIIRCCTRPTPMIRRDDAGAEHHASDYWAAAVTEPSSREFLERLVGVRAEIGPAEDLTAASYVACHALDRASGERSAWCAVTNAARKMLETVIDRLDRLVAAQSEGRVIQRSQLRLAACAGSFARQLSLTK